MKIEYPDLPVVAKKEEFLKLLKSHQVIIVQADTGSGKSTQLPKFLLESSLTKLGRIGVTEPRRLAALSIADRLREELKNPSLVSTRIRFLEEGPADAPIKVMTDGILLQEFRKDKLFKRYAAVMIDEVHERSLNIDILLGIFKTVLEKRPEFRLVIASATLDGALLQDFYKNAVVLKAEGRSFPVEIFYSDFKAEEENEEMETLVDFAKKIIVDVLSENPDHLLCFLPTEQDIIDLKALLQNELQERTFDVLPLFGRMSPAEQRRVFNPSSKIRVVLATNIAETSLTIPGIRYVVDSGLARISRYNAQSRIQGLPIEKVSKASAMQRAGRAGRVKEGVCVRLYSEEDFLEREDFSEPEIRRSNLANVVLQLQSLGLNVDEFSFLQAPPKSAFRGAYKVLFELGALDDSIQGASVTPLGFEMAKLPMDVSLSAVLLRARELNVLKPTLIVTAALSIQDPRLFPSEAPEKLKARELHRKWMGHKSDFLVFIALWNSINKAENRRSWNVLRRFCTQHFLHFLRVKEWIDLVEQYSRLMRLKHMEEACALDSFHRDTFHMALLSGFLSGVAKRDNEKNCFKLSSGREAYVFPGSDLHKRKVDFLFAAEIRETSRVYLTKNAEIKPEWIYKLAKNLCSVRYYAPFWNRERGFVEISEEVLFKGLLISKGKKRDYAKIDPDEAAIVFFREAVVLMDMIRPFEFMKHNQKVLKTLEAIEARERNFGLVPSEDAQVDWFVSKIEGVNSIRSLKDYIVKNGDRDLKYKLDYFLEATPSGVEYHEKFEHKLKIPSFNKKQRVQKKDSEKEEFSYFYLGGQKIKGSFVFNASLSNDGLSLNLPISLITELNPSTFALKVEVWRHWILDFLIQGQNKKLQVLMRKDYGCLDDVFCEFLEKNVFKSPFYALILACKKWREKEGFQFHLNLEKEAHLNLHLEVLNTEGNLVLDLSPEWGAFQFFDAVEKNLLKSEVYYRFPAFYYLKSSNKIISIEEYDFFTAIEKRLRSFQNSKDFVQKKEKIRDAIYPFFKKVLIQDPRFKLDFERILEILILDGLKVEEFIEKGLKTPETTGLKSHKKTKSFNDLRSLTLEIKEDLQNVLIRFILESGYLGKKIFVKAWPLINLRIGEDLRKTLTNYMELGLKFNRILFIRAYLNGEDFSPVSEPFLENSKHLRNLFRPWITEKLDTPKLDLEFNEFIKDLDRCKSRDQNNFDIWIRAQVLYEKLELQGHKKGFFYKKEQETLQKQDLHVLKERFAKL